MFYQLVVLCCLMLISWLWLNKRKIYKRIVGFDYRLMNSLRLYTTTKYFSYKSLEKGGVLTIYLGPYKIYAITDPDDCVTVMNSSLKRHYIFDFAKIFLGNGIITADVPTWKRNRKLLNPAFNQQILDSYVDVFNAQAQSLVDRFAGEVGKPFDQENLLRINNLETICSTSYGIDTREYSDLLKDYMPRLPKLLKNITSRIQKFWLHSNFIYNLTGEKRKQEEEANRFMELSKLIIQMKKSERSSVNKVKVGNIKTFLDFLLDLADETGSFTDEQIREETDTIVASGHDTTATLLTFVLTILGSNINVQEKTYEEILSVLGNSNKNIDKDDLSKLVYTEAVIKETLRLYPLLPILPRHTDKDVKLKNSTIKANSECFIFVYGLHRHPIWGPDADQFRPERWLEKETLPDPKYFGGFGLGRRACIGKVYAMMSMKIALAHVIRRYNISSNASKMVLKLHAVARPASGHHITVTHRNV